MESFPATPGGYRDMFAWLGAFGPLERVGVEGTGAYGAGLFRFLTRRRVAVIEVDWANRQVRRQHGKSNPLDAVEAARAAQSGRARSVAKSRDGNVEAIRALVVTRRSARAMRAKTLVQIRHLGFTAPDQLRQRLAGHSALMLANAAAELRARSGGEPVRYATRVAIRSFGRRALALEAEAARIGGDDPASGSRRA